jgi:hypothetical protein
MNLYLYIPLTSAHPAKILHSLIYGRLCAYKLQNSNTKDFVSMAVLLAKRLCLCGYSLCTMIPIFQAATNHLMERATHSLPSTEANQTQQPRTKYVNCANPMIFYLKYHPHGITRQNVHKVYKETLGPHIPNQNLRIAVSHTQNLGDHICSTRLPYIPGHNPSDYITCGNNKTSPQILLWH